MKTYLKIPKDIQARTDITWIDKAIFCYVKNWGEECFEGKAKMAEKLGISERQVKRSLKKLVELGFLTKNIRKGKYTSYSAVS